MQPEDVGQGASNLVMGKHSGRHAFRDKLKDLGYELGQNAAERGLPALQGPGRQEEARLRRRHHRPGRRRPGRAAPSSIQVKHLRVIAGTDGPQAADLTVTVDGEETHRHRHRRRSGGRGVQRHPRRSCRTTPILRLFQVHAVTEGTDAQAQVSVRLEEDGRIATGQAADTDTLTASAKAYVNALNNLFARKEKSAPDAIASGF